VSAGFRNPAQRVELNLEPYFAASAEQLIRAWIPLTVAINGVNRSMGQPDLYPFVMSKPVVQKLEFVHELIHRRQQSRASAKSSPYVAASEVEYATS